MSEILGGVLLLLRGFLVSASLRSARRLGDAERDVRLRGRSSFPSRASRFCSFFIRFSSFKRRLSAFSFLRSSCSSEDFGGTATAFAPDAGPVELPVVGS